MRYLVATLVISIGFVALQTFTNPLIRLFWQEVVFSIILVIWLKVIKINAWKKLATIFVLHIVFMCLADTSYVSEKNILPAYWVSMAICTIPVLLVSKIANIANKS